jgi:hypothetical protein
LETKPPSYSICNRPSHQRSAAFLQKKKENSRMSDLHKRKELWSVWWKRNQNNLQKKINPKLTYKKRRLWSNKTETTYKKKESEPNLQKKKENLNWPKKRKKSWTILQKGKDSQNWSTKKKKETESSYKKKICWPMK